MARLCNGLRNNILSPLFLTLEQVKKIHEDQIFRYGGIHGVRDEALLDSAISMPAQTFGGEFLHTDLLEMAAAYAFHISKNHPFFDGNKRTGMASALVFLKWNELEYRVAQNEFEAVILGVAEGRVNKKEIAEFLRKNLFTPNQQHTTNSQ